MIPIEVEGLAQLGRSDDLGGDVMPAVQHVQMHVTVKSFEGMFLKQRCRAARFGR